MSTESSNGKAASDSAPQGSDVQKVVKAPSKKAAKEPGGEMSVREAGKKGGDTVRERYGSGFYEAIGRKGGQATRERHGAAFYETIGQKGGKVVKDKYGSDFYEEIGHKGGQKVKRLIEEAKRTIAENAEAAAKDEKKPT
jgi:general stress protein YciG